eukprot:CAMPEP_0178494262 /NCGR_PEP_ID=MMETSP0696-20121128/12924_1 /TAXON_ID=265572 /ORGANISM="Extubocellulus spinifer, Strain CCMP396" /LENGTH=341 /DNA_ID=CAMNT_0020122335 /DNA_START=79 /DNA_END=1104 /DNA_ORIENTATION=+
MIRQTARLANQLSSAAAARGRAQNVLARTFSTARRPTPVVRAEAKQGEVDPEEVFAAIDTNKDGVLQKEEFLRAVEMLHYQDLLKISKAIARNELSYETEHASAHEAESFGQLMARRIQVTAEVAVSKLFPAGFGWQTAATFAEGAGMDAANMDFALATGLGDGLGVALGHTAWMAGKKMITGDEEIDVTAQAQTGIFLGSAAVCSGGAWQPFVNTLQAAGFGFNSSLVLTAGCGTLAFFSGLRIFRAIYAPIFSGVEEATYANLKADAALSAAVGGAAGCFVGTDVSYAAANWLRPLVGVEETTAAVTASVLAGSSTALGFTVVQMGENAIYPKNKCWVD